MKYVINIFAIVLLGWPSMVLGYIFGAIASGFANGMFFYNLHEAAAVKKFTTKATPQGKI